MVKTERIRFTNEEKEKMLVKTKGKCAHCGKKLTLDTMTIEHLYPLDKGGDNSEYNTIALCKQCNNEKSNWVYDTSYYGYIANKKDVYKYTYRLFNYIYNDNNDTNIFGKCNRIMYYIDTKYINMINSKKLRNNRDNLVRSIGKPIEIKQLYVGDINEEALELIRQQYIQYDSSGNTNGVCVAGINEYFLREMFKTSTFYGLYYKDTLLGIVSFTNIEALHLYDDSFKEEVYNRGYNKAYVVTMSAFKDKYYGLQESILNMTIEYMGITSNLIIGSECDITGYHRRKMRGFPITSFEIIKNNDFLIGYAGDKTKHLEYIAIDENVEATERIVQRFREQFNGNKELYEKEVGKI